VRMVYQVYEAVKIPIMGVGGISSADDVIEMISAGASAVQIGSANLINPYACRDIICELKEKFNGYRLLSIDQCTGRSHNE